MTFEKLPPEWNDIGTEPPQEKKNNGFQPGEKPPAQWMNWLFNKIYHSIKELQEKVVTTVNNKSGEVTLSAEDVGAETPEGAQEKADAALAGANTYTDQEVGEVAQALNEHLADGAQHAKTARFVIGTSTAGWTAKDCDYLCDGTADQVEINNAITALSASGGEIIILNGTYNITAKINVNKDNVSIKGNGNATILKRMWDSSSAEGVITLTSVEGCRVQNLQIDGNKTNYASNNNYGIYLDSSSNNTIAGNICNNNNNDGIRLNSSSNENTITGNICNNNNNGIRLDSSSNNTITGNTCNNNIGIYLSSSSNNTVTGNTCSNNNYGIYLDSSSNNTIAGNICNNNNNDGIRLNSSSNNTITGNICNNNNNGIRLDSSSNNTVTGNTCSNNNNDGIRLNSSSNENTVTGNACNNNSSSGIYLYSSSNNTVTGNVCNNNSYGIRLSSSSDNTVTGNTCIRGTGQTSDYTSSQYTILLSGSSNNYNLISSNNCMGKAVVVEGGTGNSAWGNKFDATDDLP